MNDEFEKWAAAEETMEATIISRKLRYPPQGVDPDVAIAREAFRAGRASVSPSPAPDGCFYAVRDALAAYFTENHSGGSDSPDFVHISGGVTPQSRGTTINLLALTDAVLAALPAPGATL